ncbi:hypothetical protein V9K67_24365 [Paraflavisolibacter sp. H34]|uniref:hypothetical protein n=1 Tax=Huijunlia imazamoxiresistens TaxID=3127457 RepID=UPI00301B0ADC
MKQTVFLLLQLCCSFCLCSAQRVETGKELQQLLKICQAYRQVIQLSFEVEFTYADSARPEEVLERLRGLSKISNGRYWGMIDSVELVEGLDYSLGIFYQDSLITVANKPPQTNVLQLPLLDTVFLAANVDSMRITGRQKEERVLTIFFKNTSLYSRYCLYYNAQSFLVSRMEYFTRALHQDDPAGGAQLITVRLSHYSFDPVPGELFREDRVLSRTGGAFSTTPAFAAFKIIDNTAK